MSDQPIAGTGGEDGKTDPNADELEALLRKYPDQPDLLRLAAGFGSQLALALFKVRSTVLTHPDERRIDDLEGEIEAYDLGQKNLSDEIAELENDEKVDEELAKLKAKMGGSSDTTENNSTEAH